MDQVILPGLIQFRIIIRGPRDTRSDKMCFIFYAQVDKRSISQRIVISEIGSTGPFPQQETHGNFALEYLGHPDQTFQREGLQDHFTVGISYINRPVVDIKRRVLGFRFFDNIHILRIGQYIIHDLFESFGIQPGFFKFDIDSRDILISGFPYRIDFIPEIIFHNIGSTAQTGNRFPCFPDNGILPGHSRLIAVPDQPIPFRIHNQVFQCGNILLFFSQSGQGFFEILVIEPTTGIEHQQFFVSIISR